MFMIGFLKLQKKMEKLGEEARIELGDNLLELRELKIEENKMWALRIRTSTPRCKRGLNQLS